MKNDKQWKKMKLPLEMILAIIAISVPAAPMNDTPVELLVIFFGLLLGSSFIYLGLLRRSYGLVACACIGIAIALFKLYGGWSFREFF